MHTRSMVSTKRILLLGLALSRAALAGDSHAPAASTANGEVCGPSESPCTDGDGVPSVATDAQALETTEIVTPKSDPNPLATGIKTAERLHAYEDGYGMKSPPSEQSVKPEKGAEIKSKGVTVGDNVDQDLADLKNGVLPFSRYQHYMHPHTQEYPEKYPARWCTKSCCGDRDACGFRDKYDRCCCDAVGDCDCCKALDCSRSGYWSDMFCGLIPCGNCSGEHTEYVTHWRNKRHFGYHGVGFPDWKYPVDRDDLQNWEKVRKACETIEAKIAGQQARERNMYELERDARQKRNRQATRRLS